MESILGQAMGLTSWSQRYTHCPQLWHLLDAQEFQGCQLKATIQGKSFRLGGPSGYRVSAKPPHLQGCHLGTLTLEPVFPLHCTPTVAEGQSEPAWGAQVGQRTLLIYRGPSSQHQCQVPAYLPGCGDEGQLLGIRVSHTPYLLEP